ncbi:MAG TPA: SDR family oxidoreductase [Candidatus Elarobacter sp.]|nr:SDR family oxidoreductase [Candidatus Elarobacter sp.]
MSVEIDLAGRRALVTGGGNGVGAAICAALVRAGAFVWVNDINEARAASVAADLGGDAHARPVKADVTSPVKITRMRETTGPVDILVNNAGIPTTGFGELKLFVDTMPDDWESAMRLNLGAVLHVTHAYAGAMVETGWGRIVTIVSDAGRRGERFQAIYGAAKAGAMGFMRGLAAEVGPHGVTANCVALGTMRTGALAEAIVERPELEAKMAKRYTVPRLGLPDDPAVLVALLCSDAGSWITGQTYPVNGGYSSAL